MVSAVSLALFVNALKFLSNPLVLLSVLLAGSLAFGGCQSKRIAGFKLKAEEHRAQIASLSKAAQAWEAKAVTNASLLAAANRDLETRATENTALRTELASCQQVRLVIEAEKQRAVAASERARKDAETTLASVTERFALYVRKPQCRAAMELPLCD